MLDSQSREPRFESLLLHFAAWAIFCMIIQKRSSSDKINTHNDMLRRMHRVNSVSRETRLVREVRRLCHGIPQPASEWCVKKDSLYGRVGQRVEWRVLKGALDDRIRHLGPGRIAACGSTERNFCSVAFVFLKRFTHRNLHFTPKTDTSYFCQIFDLI